MDKLILQNRETGDTWESGNRGKPPKWVSIHPDYIAWKIKKSTEIKVIIPDIHPVSNKLKAWKFASNNREFKSSTVCVVLAFSDLEAMTLLNKTFKNPVTSNEFSMLWTPTIINELKNEGVYERIGKDDWKIRPIIH